MRFRTLLYLVVVILSGIFMRVSVANVKAQNPAVESSGGETAFAGGDATDSARSAAAVRDTITAITSIYGTEEFSILNGERLEVWPDALRKLRYEFATTLPIYTLLRDDPGTALHPRLASAVGESDERAVRTLCMILAGAADQAFRNGDEPAAFNLLLATFTMSRRSALPRNPPELKTLALGWLIGLKCLESQLEVVNSDVIRARILFALLMKQSFKRDLIEIVAAQVTALPTVESTPNSVVASAVLGFHEWWLIYLEQQNEGDGRWVAKEPYPRWNPDSQDLPGLADRHESLRSLRNYVLSLEVFNRMGALAILLMNHKVKQGEYPPDSSLRDTFGVGFLTPVNGVRIEFGLVGEGFILQVPNTWGETKNQIIWKSSS